MLCGSLEMNRAMVGTRGSTLLMPTQVLPGEELAVVSRRSECSGVQHVLFLVQISIKVK